MPVGRSGGWEGCDDHLLMPTGSTCGWWGCVVGYWPFKKVSTEFKGGKHWLVVSLFFHFYLFSFH